MPKRIAVNTIFVIREGQRKKIMPGTEIDLTAAELEDIKKANPDAVRAPINESVQRTVSVGKAGKDDKAEI